MSINEDRAAAGAAGIRRSRLFPPVGRLASGVTATRRARSGTEQTEGGIHMDYMDADWTPVREESRRESGHCTGIVLKAVVVMAAMAAIAVLTGAVVCLR